VASARTTGASARDVMRAQGRLSRP
jgi:hypothetical protein